MLILETKETWKRIYHKGRKTNYDVSSYGRVRHHHKLNILKPRFRNDGYVYYQLHIRGKIKKINAHILVARAYLEPIHLTRVEVNHINGNKLDNYIGNLEYVTRTENIRHAYLTGLNHNPHGFEARHNIYTEEDIKKAILLLKEGYGRRKVSELTNVKYDTIWLISKGRRYKDLAVKLGLLK